MATAKPTVDAILDAARAAGALSARKMFGEYALYLDGKVVALICDDRLHVKPTALGRALHGEWFSTGAPEGAPYPGAKPHLLADDLLDEPDRLVALLRATAAALPLPAPKRKKR